MNKPLSPGGFPCLEDYRRSTICKEMLGSNLTRRNPISKGKMVMRRNRLVGSSLLAQTKVVLVPFLDGCSLIERQTSKVNILLEGLEVTRLNTD